MLGNASAVLYGVITASQHQSLIVYVYSESSFMPRVAVLYVEVTLIAIYQVCRSYAISEVAHHTLVVHGSPVDG